MNLTPIAFDPLRIATYPQRSMVTDPIDDSQRNHGGAQNATPSPIHPAERMAMYVAPSVV
jgi:hypothetical protein